MNPFAELQSDDMDFEASERGYCQLSPEALLALEEQRDEGEALMTRFLRDNRALMTEATLLQAARSAEPPPVKLSIQPSLLHRIPSQPTLQSEPSSPPSSHSPPPVLTQSHLVSAVLKSRTRPVHYNIILVGGCRTGKTSFLSEFWRTKIDPLAGKRSRRVSVRPTSEIEHHKAVVRGAGFDLYLDLIDTPGFAGDVESRLGEIQNYILAQARKYAESKENTVRSQRVDTRVHLCLYFVKGAGVEERDLRAMRKLQEVANILVIVAGGGTEEEMREAKRKVREACSQAQIRPFDISLAAPSKLPDLSSSPLGPCPPFVLPHPLPCPDFALLSKLLIGHFLLPSRTATKSLLKRYAAAEAENLRTESQRRQRLTVVSVASAVTLGLWALLRR